MELHGLIREARESIRMTQKDLADKAGLSPQYLNDVERGRRAISARTVIALSRALALPEDLLFGAAGLLPDDIRSALARAKDKKLIQRAFSAMRRALDA